MSDNNSNLTDNTYFYLARIIGNKFKKKRKQRYMSMRNIYEKENISIAIISDFERGKKIPRMETLVKLCNCIDLDLSEIFNPKLFKYPKEQKNIDTEKGTIRAFKILTDETFLKQALILKGLSEDEQDDVLKYIDFLLYKKR